MRDHVIYIALAVSSTTTLSTGDFWPVTSSRGLSNHPCDDIDVSEAFVIHMERSARGRMRAKRPPQRAAVDPWIPRALAPPTAPMPWPTQIRRFRGNT